jgi:hypothetical protein
MMKELRLNVVITLALASIINTPAFSQSPTSIVGEQLNALTSGRSWAISFYREPTNPALTAVWDFRKDGSVCARMLGSKGDAKCADEGKWTTKGEMLCWELTWLGESGGYKTACSSVSKAGADRFELRSQKMPEVVVAAFMVMGR